LPILHKNCVKIFVIPVNQRKYVESESFSGIIRISIIHRIWNFITMAGRRKRPTLRFSNGYWVTTIYRPNGVRGTVSFGTTERRSESEIRIAFETWIELYLKHPRKTLSFSSPYEALVYMINPTTITTVKAPNSWRNCRAKRSSCSSIL
jgi:hypothetical protein